MTLQEWLVSVGVEKGISGCHELYEWGSGYVACQLAEGLGAWDSMDEDMGMEGCWRWVWWIDGGKYMESVWQFKIVEKLLDVCVIGGVRRYNVVGLVRKWWSRGGD